MGKVVTRSRKVSLADHTSCVAMLRVLHHCDRDSRARWWTHLLLQILASPQISSTPHKERVELSSEHRFQSEVRGQAAYCEEPICDAPRVSLEAHTEVRGTLEAMCLVADHMTQPDLKDLPSTQSSVDLLDIPSSLFSVSDTKRLIEAMSRIPGNPCRPF